MTEKPPSPDEFDARLRAARSDREVRERESPMSTSSRDLGLAYRVAIEMAVGLAVGAGLGWLLDSWLGTRPFLLLAMMLLGFAAGVSNAIRASRQVTAAAERREQEELAARRKHDSRAADDR